MRVLKHPFSVFIPILLPLLLALIPLPFPPLNPQSQSIASNYIVRFLNYKLAADHRAYLESHLRSSPGWRWIERRNPAVSFPTDFGVLELDDSYRSGLIVELQGLELVKDVVVDSSYSRSLFVDESEKDWEPLETRKGPGKLFTSTSFEEDGGSWREGNGSRGWRRELLAQRSQVTSLFGAEELWAKEFTGAKVKMAIFDTGIRANHPHFRNIKERTNWTNEDTLNDNIGHGTFVAGVIAGEDPECLGFAPDTEIYAFRVFTDAQVSYTSWFLDAFNYAMATNMDVLNLSIGGPDYLDLPFVEKVWELTANNIIMVSAIGNDGPLYGTLNNPADQSDVIGVGGIDYNNHIASFSSRGMSTWEIPHGYGRVKPDVVAYGREIMGSKISTGCKSLSGTSVASPVVAGVVCLLVSVIPESSRKYLLNPGSMKQALVEGATKLSGPNIYEQGAGRLNLLASYEILKTYQPRASIFPNSLDYTDCPYFWPFCRQPLYAGAMPVIFNATIINGMGVVGFVESPPTWHPVDEVGNLLSIHFTYSDVIWPWTGFLALHMQIREEGTQFSGVIEGNVTVKVYSPALGAEKDRRSSTCVLHLKLKVIPTPHRSKRILWDQFHNIKYPPGYIPRDSLDVRNDILDWHGDHLHTNFHVMYNMLRDAGYYIETLGSPFTCFDASRYGTLLMVDLEDEYFKEEIEKLRDDVINVGLGLAVFADWYNVDSMVKMRFFDDNTRSWWTPVTGGANVPALNDLLAPLGIAFGDKILTGDFSINGEQSHYASGTDIVKFPGGGFVHSFQFQDNSESGATQNILQSSGMIKESAILGFVDAGRGRVAVYGDSNCLDSSHMVTNCYWLLRKILDFTSEGNKDPVLFHPSKMTAPLHKDKNQLPSRRNDVNFSTYSAVVGKDLLCHKDSRFEVWRTKGYGIQLMGRNRKLPGYPAMDVDSGLNSKANESKRQLEETLRETKWIYSREVARNKLNKTMDFLGLLNHDETDLSMLVLSQWLVPAFVAMICLLLFLSWRMRQKRRRRRKGSGSGSARMTNLV
ncbi:subtilisin-like protease SBT6.1 [Dioscorea cayenensis subsp. rotundata]|uniref:Subtilisin-like protease SBT6.1 n=1 Tax=Dioscorea cayennensis subsp. rotundata TaxID=55577 RepID=A0AB40CY20_DIOCR|nr:subtilisin-like protease SBT6.1 [Dioscorea cayenensis subsp. rotundata]